METKIAGNAKAQVEFTIKFTLTKEEAKALDAIAGYGSDAFLKVFYEHMGKNYLGALEDEILKTIQSSKNNKPKDINTFLELFYVKMGKAYLQPHEKGLRNLFARIRADLPIEIDKIEEAEERINEALKDFNETTH